MPYALLAARPGEEASRVEEREQRRQHGLVGSDRSAVRLGDDVIGELAESHRPSVLVHGATAVDDRRRQGEAVAVGVEVQLSVESDRRHRRLDVDLGRIGECRRQPESGGHGRLALDLVDHLGCGGVHVGGRPREVAVGARRVGQLGDHRHAGLVGFAVRPRRVLATLVDEPGVGQAVLRRHLAGRVPGGAGGHAVHVDDDDAVPGALEQKSRWSAH